MTPNWRFITAVAAVIAVPIIAAQTPADPRLLSVLLGCIAMFGLAYRFVSTYQETPTIARVLGVLLFATLMLGAIGQYQLHGVAPLTVVTYPVLGQRIGCILVAFYWPRLLGYGNSSPWALRHGTYKP